MGAKTGITWTDSTWNPIRGCSRMVDSMGGTKETDPLCANCYAARVASHPWWSAPGKPYDGLTVLQNNEPLWTGRVDFIQKHLADPLKWREPRRIFVNSMSDLFHEKLSFDLIDEVVYVMQKARQHTFQVLTKRVARVLEYARSSPARAQLMQRNSHIWWGASVGTQRHADLRVPIMLQWPVAVRWLSMEPLLEAVSLRKWLRHEYSFAHARNGFCEDCRLPKSDLLHFSKVGLSLSDREDARSLRGDAPIQWIVVGGESGPKDRIRRTELHWYRFLRAQAEFAGVPFFMKQLGELDGPDFANIDTFPESLRVREFPCDRV